MNSQQMDVSESAMSKMSGQSSGQDAYDTSTNDVSMVDLQRESELSNHYDSRNNSAQFIENVANENISADQQSSLASSAPHTSSPSNGSLKASSSPNRRSTLILTEDMDTSKIKDDSMMIDDENDIGSDYQEPEKTAQQQSILQPIGRSTQQQSQSQPQSQPEEHQSQQQQVASTPQPPQIAPQPILVPTVFKWTEGGSKVFVMGTFTGWRKMIALNGPSQKDGSFSVQIALPQGTHRFKFVVDNEVRISGFIPTATDTSGHFVNYLEVIANENDGQYSSLNQQQAKSKVSLRAFDSKLGLTKDDDDMGDGYTRYHDADEVPPQQKEEYITSIPPIFTDPKVMEEYYVTLDNNQRSGNHNQQWLIPPQLPPHLESVILNSYNHSDKDNTSGALSIPNHVVLNHLATTSIKHNTLAVASVVRYKKKYVTQILYAPLQ